MKAVCPLLLAFFAGAFKLSTPHVTISPVTATTYLQARKVAPVVTEKRTFPLKKTKGSILVPTTAGNKAFKDKKSANEMENVTYTYLGYLPRVQQHLLQISHWEGEERLVDEVLAVRTDGRIIKLFGEPIYSPDQKHLAVFLQIPDYNAMVNEIQVLAQQAGKVKLMWEATPETWEPVEVFWATNTTAYVKQKQYKNGKPYKPERFTYAKLLMN